MNKLTDQFREQLFQMKEDGLNAEQAVEKLKSEHITGNVGEKGTAAMVTSQNVGQDLSTAIMSVFDGLTPLELAQLLKLYQDDPTFVAAGIMAPDGFPDTTALQLGTLLLDPTLFPTLSKAEMYAVLTNSEVGFSAADATAAVNTLFKTSFALTISGNPSFLSAPSNSAYSFGTSDFSLQCWVKTTASGTVISRKPGEGGAGNGGFLLVIKSNGVIKFATDNGFGFYEVNTASATLIRDGNWHYLSAVRQSNSLSIYLDGNLVPVIVGSNISPPINVNNNLPLLMGNVAQWQEQFRQFTGQLDQVRIWSRALSQVEIRDTMNRSLAGNEPGLVGLYTFSNQNGEDSSPTRNNASPTGTITYTSPGAIG